MHDAKFPPAVGEPVRTVVDWAAALAHHGRWLRRIIHTRLGEPQAVDEVMQEVSLAAVARPANGVAPAQAAAWLYRVAVRQTLLYRRRSGRRRKLLDRVGSLARSGEPAADAPLDWLLCAERDELIRAALQQLPRRESDVLVLKYTEGWSCRQIAEHLGSTESAVDARLHRARARLRAELSRHRLNEDVT